MCECIVCKINSCHINDGLINHLPYLIKTESIRSWSRPHAWQFKWSGRGDTDIKLKPGAKATRHQESKRKLLLQLLPHQRTPEVVDGLTSYFGDLSTPKENSISNKDFVYSEMGILISITTILTIDVDKFSQQKHEKVEPEKSRQRQRQADGGTLFSWLQGLNRLPTPEDARQGWTSANKLPRENYYLDFWKIG